MYVRRAEISAWLARRSTAYKMGLAGLAAVMLAVYGLVILALGDVPLAALNWTVAPGATEVSSGEMVRRGPTAMVTVVSVEPKMLISATVFGLSSRTPSTSPPRASIVANRR